MMLLVVEDGAKPLLLPLFLLLSHLGEEEVVLVLR
jgi:hypothetical protein